MPKASPPDAFYFPTDTTPEELFVAIGKLRKEARDEIDRLIGFLDKTDDYVSRELRPLLTTFPAMKMSSTARKKRRTKKANRTNHP